LDDGLILTILAKNNKFGLNYIIYIPKIEKFDQLKINCKAKLPHKKHEKMEDNFLMENISSRSFPYLIPS